MASTKGPYDASNPPVTPKVYTSGPQSPEVFLGGPTTSSERLDALEKNWKNHVAEVVSLKTSMVKLSGSLEGQDVQGTFLQNSIEEIFRRLDELHRHLRATIRGVTRLSQGKSTGNLGLPMDEDWTEFKS